MIDDVDQLRGMQPRIAGVQHHAAARHREINLEVPMRVAGNGADVAACVEAQGFERIRQASRAVRALGINISMEGPVRLARDDFHLAKLGGGMLDDAGDQERPIHHQARTQHCENPLSVCQASGLAAQFDTKRASRQSKRASRQSQGSSRPSLAWNRPGCQCSLCRCARGRAHLP